MNKEHKNSQLSNINNQSKSEAGFMNKKSYKISAVAASLLCLIPVIIGLFMYDKLPDMLPTHINVSGEIDGYSSKNTVIFFIPAMLAFFTVFLSIMTYFDPFDKLKKNKNSKLILIFLFLMPFISNLSFYLSYNWNKGQRLSPNIPVFVFGLILTIVANYMPKNKQNSMIGFRTPWALKDEENWNRTNRLGGFMLMFFGMFMMLSVFIYPLTGNIVYRLIFPLAMLLAFLPFGYSFYICIKKNR